ncbi:hypothetical protein E3P99_03459 [Wallemia hederae]|uniref:Autophagy-related protein 14 n=1 Tax=Wallemia hederae TaxID=1540922 RepID=A0A4T0FI49_9BASI|nr:hypothetical protein E3P99_03459 [Wallemia hederae]
MKSENFDQIVRLATLVNCNYELSSEVVELDGRISNSTRSLKLARQVDDLSRRDTALSEALDKAREDIDRATHKIHARRRSLQERRRHLSELVEKEETGTATVASTSKRALPLSTKKRAKTIRSHLLSTLSALFPIVNLNSTFTFSILGLTLDHHNPIHSSSALGYTCLLTLLLSDYLSTHLPYQIVYKGSQSYIIDNISNIRGSNAFPLHAHLKKDHLYRLQYAIYLLNKDIEVVGVVYLHKRIC